MSDEATAIHALDRAMRRYDISRDLIPRDNRLKLELHAPRCAICLLTEEQTGECISMFSHQSCRAHLASQEL